MGQCRLSSSRSTGLKQNSSSLATSQATKELDIEHITESANVWSVVGFLVTGIATGLYVAFAWTGKKKYPQFFSWIVTPICGTAMVLSLCLKPRKTDF